MKNFTKQNFKTNPLWIRLLIMGFMLLAGAGNVWSATHTFIEGEYIFIKNFKPSGWGDCWIPSNGYAWAHMWGGTAGEKDYLFELHSGTAGAAGAIYRAKITTAGTYTSIIFTRNSSNKGPWDDKWNQTETISLNATNNCATSFSSGGTSCTWSCYPTSVTTYNLNGSSGSTVKLSSSQIGLIYDLYKDNTIVSGQTKAGNGSSLTWTVTEGGAYTVKASNACKSATAMTGTHTYTPVSVTGYKLAGFNDWSNEITMTKDGNSYSCTKLLAEQEYATNTEAGFKIIEVYSDDTKKWYGNNGTMTRNGQYVQSGGWSMEEGKNNCGITADVAGTYTFTFDATNKKLTVKYPPECTTTTFSWTTAPVNMNYGETKDIVATLNPAEAGTVSYTASPADIVTINNNTYTAVATGDVTITAKATLNDGYCPVSDLTKSIKVTCPTPEQPELYEGKAILNNCGNIAPGIIKIENYENYGKGYTFELDGTPVPLADDGTISVYTAKEYTVTVTNECGSEKNNKVTISEDIITEPNNSFTVSASIPQIKFDDNDGSININLSGSESGVTYNLYNGDVIVENTTKIGTGNSLEWTGIVTPGIYKVKANNPCDGGTIQMTGSFDYQCISDLKIEFEGGNNTFCPNGSANIIISLKGTDFTKYTNAGNYGWKWVYTTGGLSYALSTKPANKAKHVVTIKKAGTVKLQIRTCGGILESNELSYNIVTAPEKPQLDDYAMEVCTGETAEIIISDYNDSYTYQLYKNSTIVETPEFDAGVFTVSEAGEYTVKAVEAECGIASVPSDPFILSTSGTTITPPVAEIHPYEVVTFTAGEQAKWALYTNPSSGSQLSDDDAKYSGKDTAYITKGESTTTKFKGEAANGYVIHATVGDCTASYTFNVVEDPNNCQ